MMQTLERLYASSGPEVILPTLQLTTASVTYYLVRGWDDITATLETAEAVTFTACGMDVAKPAKNADGTQDLQFALGNLDGSVSEAIRQALQERSKMTVTYREYISTDLSAPQKAAYTMQIKGGSWTRSEAQIKAGYMNLLDTAWPRDRYTLNHHPGLRYM